jgi:tetratricopeptide (TPR) repeat protein
MLPWLRIAAELDPHRVETYTVTAYWLRTRLGNVKAAEEFLRDGLRANPDSHEILFELGRLYYENRNDADRARNVWLAAVRKFEQQAAAEPEPDWFPLQQLLVHLARLEETEGHLDQAIHHLERLKPLSPAPVEIQKHIDLLSARSKPTALGPPPR